MSFLLVSIDAMPLALSRFFLPGFLSFLLILFLKIKIKLKDILKFILAGLIGIFFYNFFLNTGQQTVSAGATSFIVNCNPLFATFIGFYFLKQKVKLHFWLGIIICIIGVFIISLGTHTEFNLNFGVIYILLAALLTSSYFHIIKPLVNKYGALTSFSYTVFFGTLPMLVWSADVYNIVYSASVEVLLQILWLSIVCTLLGYYTWTYSVGYFGANKASFFLFLIPVFSIIIDFIVFQKVVNTYTLIGGTLILFSVSIIIFLNLKENKFI